MEGDRRILISPAVAKQIRHESTHGLPSETEGVLVGYETEEGTRVTRATGPGPRARRTRSRFRRDSVYTQGEVIKPTTNPGGREDYVGEWHSHPDSVGPSRVDSDGMEWVSKNVRYHRPSPVMNLARQTRFRRWKLEGYRLKGANLVSVPLVSRAFRA